MEEVAAGDGEPQGFGKLVFAHKFGEEITMDVVGRKVSFRTTPHSAVYPRDIVHMPLGLFQQPNGKRWLSVNDQVSLNMVAGRHWECGNLCT